MKLKTLCEIMLPTDLPNLYIKKYSNLLQLRPERVMIFLYGTTVSLIKLLLRIKISRFEASAQN